MPKIEKIELKPEHLRFIHYRTLMIADGVREIMATLQRTMKSAPDDLMLASYGDIFEKLELIRNKAIRNREDLEAQGETVDPEQKQKIGKFSSWANSCWVSLTKMAGKLIGKIDAVRNFKLQQIWQDSEDIGWQQSGIYTRIPEAAGPWVTLHIPAPVFYRIQATFSNGKDAIRDLYEMVKGLETESAFPPETIKWIYPQIRGLSITFSQVYILLDRLYCETNRGSFQYYPPDPLVEYVEVDEKPEVERQMSAICYSKTPLGKLYRYSKLAMSSAMQGLELLFDLYHNMPDSAEFEHTYAPDIPRKIRIVRVRKGERPDQDHPYDHHDRYDQPNPPLPPPPNHPLDEPRIRSFKKPRNPHIPEWYDELPWFTLRTRYVEKLINALAAGFLRPMRV